MANSYAYRIALRAAELLQTAVDEAGLDCTVYFNHPDSVRIATAAEKWINVRPSQIGIITNAEPSQLAIRKHGMVLTIELCVKTSYEHSWRDADELWVAIHPVMHPALSEAFPGVIVNCTYRGMRSLDVDDEGASVQFALSPEYLVHFRTAELAVDRTFF